MFMGHGLSTFNPKNLANLKLWLDAANPSNNGTRPTSGTVLTTWVDVSGATGNFTNTAGSPQFKTNIQNGLPGVQLFGTETYSHSLSIGSNISVFVVSTSSNTSFFMEQSTNSNVLNGFYLYGAGSNCAQIRNSSATVQTGGVASWSGTSCVLLAETYNGTTLTALKNGVSSSTGTTSIPNATTTDTLYIGSRGQGSLFMTGYIHEILIYNAFLSAGQQALVNDYLRRKWAIF